MKKIYLMLVFLSAVCNADALPYKSEVYSASNTNGYAITVTNSIAIPDKKVMEIINISSDSDNFQIEAAINKSIVPMSYTYQLTPSIYITGPARINLILGVDASSSGRTNSAFISYRMINN